MRASRVLREHSQNKISTCLKSNLSDPRVTEIAGLAGFSSIWFCNEHVPTDWSTLEHCVRAAKIYDMDVIIRVEKGSYSDYIKPFEMDAAGVMVPHVTSAEEARQVVDKCRFRPIGNRALDGGNMDGEFCRIPIDKYIEASNREKFIIIQIESPKAVEVIDEIAAVEGYDFLLFGPGDFSNYIGKPGQTQDPEVLAAREKVEIAARKHGKIGFSVGAKGTPGELKARGYGATTLGADVTTLSAHFDEMLKKWDSQLESGESSYYKKKE